MKRVDVWTDGSMLGGIGGVSACSAILVFYPEKGDKVEKVITRAFAASSCNRAELWGVVEVLKVLEEPCKIRFHTDAMGVVKGMDEKLIERLNHQKKGTLPNADLWKLIDGYINHFGHHCYWVWVKGHSGDAMNTRCDQLAFAAATKAAADGNAPRDKGFDAIVEARK